MAHGQERKIFAFVQDSGRQIVNFVCEFFLSLTIAFFGDSQDFVTHRTDRLDFFAAERIVKT